MLPNLSYFFYRITFSVSQTQRFTCSQSHPKRKSPAIYFTFSSASPVPITLNGSPEYEHNRILEPFKTFLDQKGARMLINSKPTAAIVVSYLDQNIRKHYHYATYREDTLRTARIRKSSLIKCREPSVIVQCNNAKTSALNQNSEDNLVPAQRKLFLQEVQVILCALNLHNLFLFSQCTSILELQIQRRAESSFDKMIVVFR